MEKKILKIQLTNNKNIYPSEEETKNYDLYINRHGFVYDTNMQEINDFKFSMFDKRRVLTIMLVGIEEDLLLEQLLTIQQIDILTYLYKYFGESFKLKSDIVTDTSLLSKIASQK